MKTHEVRDKYISFFKSAPRNHIEINPAPLVLSDDPTTLFTSSGMQPLVPYLLGKDHPEGNRLVNSQPSMRTQDIEEVGDNRHTTFFEMLGNWSLGEYFKKEQLEWFFDFLTKELKLDPKKLYVSVFSGDTDFGVLKDDDSISIWKTLFEKEGIEAEYVEFGSQERASKLGMNNGRIFGYGVKKNWWSRTGTPSEMPIGDIGGPDSEVFYEFEQIKHNPEFGEKCHPNCDCGRFMEIGNSVFMQYKKVAEKKLQELPKKNVDFGGGLERLTAAVNDDPDVFQIDVFSKIISEIGVQVNTSYTKDPSSFRIIADHIRGAVFLASNGVIPSNKQQGYVMRRLIRRAVVKVRKLKEGTIEPNMFTNIVSDVIKSYPETYIEKSKEKEIVGTIFDEVNKFTRTIEKGFREVQKIKEIDGIKAFDLYQTYGFPLEITIELFREKGQKVSLKEFEKEFEKHKEKSRTTSAGKFKGGLSGNSEKIKRLHTATHLLQAALRKVLGEHVIQRGQNITDERSRFDFTHNKKLSDEELIAVEKMINEVVEKAYPVKFAEMSKTDAEKIGAIGAFSEKYADTVNIYFVGEDLENAFSKEFCGGPHVKNTSQIGRVTIVKQEKIGNDIVRIYTRVK